MTDEAVSEIEDPRRPQGSWPLIIFILGLLAATVLSCQERAPAPPPSAQAVNAAAPPKPAPLPVAAPAASAPTALPANLSARAKTILVALGNAPSAQACTDAFAKASGDDALGFRRNSAKLSHRAKAALNDAAAIAGACRAHKIEIGGHTDRSGPRAYNQALSEERAAAVMAYLLSQGAPEAALSAKGYGETRAARHPYSAGSRRISFAIAD